MPASQPQPNSRSLPGSQPPLAGTPSPADPAAKAVSVSEASQLAESIRQAALSEGFIRCGIAPAITSEGFPKLVKWIEAGYAAEMGYFSARLDAYRHPRGVLPGAKSLIVMAMPYHAQDPQTVPVPVNENGNSDNEHTNSTWGRVARYTWQGTDYHDTIHPKLKRLCRRIGELAPGSNARGIIDTAPLMEREVAQLAGLGWRGKNTLLLNRELGSYFFLACILVDVELPADSPHATSHCGSCTACLDACPTDAFVQAGVLDASKCISYLTIEHRDSIPEPLRPGIGNWLFGCDVCQEVCPWNRKPARRATLPPPTADKSPSDQIDALKNQTDPTPQTQTRDSDSTAPLGWIDALALFELTEEDFRARFRRSPMWRTRRRGMLRNAAMVLGNIGGAESLPALESASLDDDPVVSESASWASQQIQRRQ
ncbi:epoxyqueuosine reductase [Neorhodopirellula lusitana]|uniref:Epoxyqueuosine reductase n=1 Tax=Neorhodopirellula lusitana TaxID=445327 RepID=A0ABY1PVV8_9BACT|nr:tRNA epoxyqueuosine(34) reductase QueG [Neorhodopirellula lusitana]SMP50519.1 epoxyqueuosine reductase [Neorhodopirellula lusitana]